VKLSKQRKVYVGILVAAVGAFAVDQLVGGGMPGPQTADASNLLVEPSERSSIAVDNQEFERLAAEGHAAEPALAPGRLTTVADQLRLLRTPGELPPDDAFALPVSLAQLITPMAIHTASGSDPAGTAIARDAALDLKLTTVVVGSLNAATDATGAGGVAVINGELRAVGSVVNGWRIVRILERSVVVRDADGREATLELPDPTAKLRFNS
jgi:hypothetical protein